MNKYFEQVFQKTRGAAAPTRTTCCLQLQETIECYPCIYTAVAHIHSYIALMENDAMIFVGLRTANTRFRIIVTLQRAKRRLRVLASGRADAAANIRGGKKDQKQRAVHNVHIGRPPTVWNFSTMQ